MLDESLEKLIQNSNDASSRSRKVLVFLCFASLIAFFSYYNARQDSWQVNRYSKIREVIENLAKWKIDKLSDGAVDSLKQTDNHTKLEVAKYLEVRKINTNEELHAYHEMFEEIRKNALSIHIPLGIILDINDLALFTGISINFFLLLFCFCLEREEGNLHHAMHSLFNPEALLGEHKERGSKKYLEYYFQRMAMSQVLTIPPKHNSALYTGFFLISKLPYFVGFYVMYLIYKYDLESRDFGTTVDIQSTLTDESSSLILLVIMGILTLLSFTYGVRIDLVWFKYFTKLQESEKTQ